MSRTPFKFILVAMTSMEPKLEKEVEVVWDSNELRHLPSPPPLIPLQSYQHGSTACSNRDLVQVSRAALVAKLM